MIGPRTRKEMMRYHKHLKQKDPGVCDFCGLDKNDKRVIEQTKDFQVINNIFPYTIWDAQGVNDHLMIIPLQHIEGLESLTDGQKIQFVDLVAKYEKKGYNIYARAQFSAVRSIVHQHTHLIKTTGIIKKFFLMTRLPYIRIVK